MAYVLRLNPHKYNNESWGSANPNYEQILVDSSTGLYGLNNFMERSEVLDPNLNLNVGLQSCTNVNMCVPSIYVPDITKKLVNESVDEQGKPTDLDYKVAEEVRDLADSILDISDAVLIDLTVSIPEEPITTDKPNIDFKVNTDTPTTNLNLDTPKIGEIEFKAVENLEDLGYSKFIAEDIEDFKDISKTTEPIIRNKDIPCRPETEYQIPDIPKDTYKDKKFQDLMDKLEDLLDDDDMPEPIKLSVDNKDLTERVVNGSGSFDWIASAIFNQLNYVRNEGLINGDDIAQVYSQSLVQGLQSAVQFTLEKEKTYTQNLLAFAQLREANIKALLAKAELLMLPSKLELQYAQLETVKKQLELLAYQVEVQKLQIPKEAAQLDQIREQTALICIQRKQALEQLAQAELDRKLKSAQIETAVVAIKEKEVDIELKEQQTTLQQQQQQLNLVQIESARENINLQKAQVMNSLEEVNIKKVQIKSAEEDISLKKGQLLGLTEDTNLKKVQVELTRRDINLKEAQLDNLIEDTNTKKAQTLNLVEDVKLKKEDAKIKNTQWQLGLKNIVLADAQLKGLVADIKLKAQQLLKDKEQVALIKAQTATAYAQVVATQEAIKASKAQYSDTIDGAEIGGVLGSQIRVHNKQAEAFDKDALYKFSSVIKDIWTAKKTADIAIRSPNTGTAMALDRVLIEYAGVVGISVDFGNLPTNYLDAMTDDEMDNGQPVS